MDGEHSTTRMRRRLDAHGVTLIETMIAAAILIVAVAGLLPLFTVAVLQNEQQGDEVTRTIEYAQDKMEQLMKLSFNDGTTDTTVFPTNPTGCTGTAPNICGLGGTMAASSTAGAVPPAAAVTKYVDYLDINGNLLTSSTGALYTRQWSISTDTTGTLKTITVTATSVGLGHGAAPSTTVVCVKSSGL